MRIYYFSLTRVIGLSILLGSLTACERSQSISLLELKRSQDQEASKQVEKEVQFDQSDGVKLIDVVGHSTVPKHDHSFRPHQIINPPSKQQLQYIGRYHTEMSCEDALIRCETGNVDYILNLLPDGSAHRTIVHLGKIYSVQTGLVKTYRKDFWTYDAACNEIIVHLVEGADLIYQVDPQQNLLLSLDKTLNVNKINNDFFSNKYPAPSYAYHLKKYEVSDSK